ncbi:MAG: VWA domain-containing protein [Acidobacteriota bacterium]|nr:MAG: VWA domain-containing protein [Acidobacteriota bacterium]
MRKIHVAGFGVLLVLVCSAFQETQIRVAVEAVNLFVTVTDKEGRFVTDVTKDRFIVYEDGVPQQITNFSSETNVPLRIGLLIDTSSSVRLKLDFEQRAAINFIRAVMQRNDQALLVEFDQGVTLLHDFTNKPTAIIREIEKLRAGGGTALRDAIFSVARDKMTDRDARKTLVIVSDGDDLNSRRSMEETLEIVQAAELTIYAIGTSRFGASSNKKGERVLEQLANESGGRAFFPYSAELLNDAFELINQELRSQYSLTYTPSNMVVLDGKFREIDVRITEGKDLRLRHRLGYRLPRKILTISDEELNGGPGKNED